MHADSMIRTRKVGVLGERLKGAPAKGVALNVACRRKQDDRGFDLGFFSKEGAHFVDHVRVEGRSHRSSALMKS